MSELGFDHVPDKRSPGPGWLNEQSVVADHGKEDATTIDAEFAEHPFLGDRAIRVESFDDELHEAQIGSHSICRWAKW